MLFALWFFFLLVPEAVELGDVKWCCRGYEGIILEVRLLDFRPESAETKRRRRKMSWVNASSFDGCKGTRLFLATKGSLCFYWKDQRTCRASAAACQWASEYGGSDVIIPVAPLSLITHTDYNSLSSLVTEQMLTCQYLERVGGSRPGSRQGKMCNIVSI